MSFLHGVLESVKEDDNVATYDNDSQNNITSVIETLNNSVGKGRQAFGKAVTQVSEWLKKHGEQVDTLTTGVSFELGKYVEDVSRQRDKPLADQLRSWTQTLSQIDADLTSLHSNNISQLDPVLRDKLMHKIDAVKSAVQVLKGSAESKELEKQVREVDETIFMQFSEIGKKIGQLREQKDEQFERIKRTVSAAKQILLKLNEECKGDIMFHFDAIKHKLDELYGILSSHKVELGALVETTRREFDLLKGYVGDYGKKKPGGDDLNTKWMQLKEKVKDYVSIIKGEGNSGLVQNMNGLNQIKDGIINYAKTFGNEENVNKFVTQWVQEIVDKDEIVKDRLKKYVSINKVSLNDRFNPTYKGETNSNEAVKKALKEHLPDFIDSLIQPVVLQAEFETAEVKNIAEKFSSFAIIVESELTGDEDTVNLEVEGIEMQLGLDSKKTASNYLQQAIKHILSSVAVSVKNFAEQLHSFFQQSHIDFLTQIGNSATQIGKQFGKDDNSFGDKIQQALNGVSQKIDELNPLLVDNSAEKGTIFKKLDAIGEQLTQLNNMSKPADDGDILMKREKSEAKMNELKECIETHLNHINANVGIANDALTISINTVIDKVKEAENEITKQIRALFAEQHIADLSALHTLVERKLAEVRKIIDEDKVTGIKGLLKSVNGMLFGINKEGMPQFNESTSETLLTKLKGAVPATTPKKAPTKQELSGFSDQLKSYLDNLLAYTELQVKFEGDHRSPTKESQMVSSINTRLDKLLNYLKYHDPDRKYIFDHNSTKYLTELNESISALSPSNFHGFHNPLLLDALKAGMTQFTEQLSHAYVNKYSGSKPTEEWVETKKADSTTSQVLSTEGRNCAKVCLTILDSLVYELDGLQKGSNMHSTKQINLANGNKLGEFFKRSGYKVATGENKQDGELRRSDQMQGSHIHTRITQEITGAKSIPGLMKWKEEQNAKQKVKPPVKDISINVIDIVDYLIEHLVRYYKVSHYIPQKTRPPTTVYEMLQWVTGLKYNHVYDGVKNHIKTLFPKPKELKDKPYSDIPTSQLTLAATTEIRYDDLTDVLSKVCSRSRSTLKTILGHGHPDGRYAVEFNTNTDNLSYPSSPAQCFDTLVDVLNRIYNQLRFLYAQCQNGRSRGGWEECHYGRYIGGSSWTCNSIQCPDQDCDQKHNQTCNHNADQKVNQHYECGIKSPLQSFLEDGLPGFLPHRLTKVGCGVKCSLGNHFGKPCLTPMGFADIGIAASRTRTGKHLFSALYRLCGRPESPLTRICSMLCCLLRRAPQTLGDMLAFYHYYLSAWEGTRKDHKSVAFDKAVSDANFGNVETKLVVVSIQGSKNHSDQHSQGDLFSLISCDSKKDSGIPCGPYLGSISEDIRSVYSKERAGNYLSWVVYITETFYDLLKQLCEQCCNKCNKHGVNCRGKKCGKDCTVKYTDGEDIKQLKNLKHSDDCHSIVKCPATHPTLFTYGFTFGSPHQLYGGNGEKKQRTCQDFCQALQRVCSDSSLLARLVHEYIPKFLWEIRKKFSYLLLALWSLSLLYLLHIAVVRLDVLRIRSHLRSPASHRIAAQSLLAAARVKALANVKYFSP
ncbi:hypothetical protein, conserved [Babesia ovata]|uniref:C3H1-type domain-containing protein n=1 Tax=Babesia ovata TaxID=189622 RepID=A0A2H6KJN7_9APIC|nr:uncharacterized protein BOVATA_046910 [Babesia ovata]GBE63198.1 hypothetical protein, conserved [Babesia ovata]